MLLAALKVSQKMNPPSLHVSYFARKFPVMNYGFQVLPVSAFLVVWISNVAQDPT
jgi:hypothetical protein